MTNKSKCLNESCSLRTVDGLCAVDKLIPCIFQEGRQRTIMANDTSYTVTGTIPFKESKEDKVQNTKEDNANAINFCLVLVLLSIAAAINVTTIYLIVKIINEIIGV